MQKHFTDPVGSDAAEPVATTVGHPSPITVLVVEDEPLVRFNATTMLASLGYLVREASCGPTGLEQLHLHREVSVLFTDIDMPGEFDGLALARKVHLLRPDVYLIMTSGRTQPLNQELCGGDFLAKPYSDQSVASMISAATERGGDLVEKI
jgi:CheY-like chemotaxis protein